jgi:hypothetical protein
MATSLSPNEELHPALIRPLPLPKGMTRDQFNDLVAHLFDLSVENGLDPSCTLSIGDFDELADGMIRHHFALFVSETVAQILENKSN